MLFRNAGSYKLRLTLIALTLTLIMIFTACSSGTSDDKSSNDQGKGNVEQNDKTNNQSENNSGQTDNGNDVDGSSQNSGSEDALKETGAPIENNPADILKAYKGQYAQVDQELIDFEVKDFEGNTVKLSDYKGKIIFLNFWATWCPPCREEMPHMQTFYDKYKDDDVIILAVNPTTVENQGIGDSKKAEEKAKKFIEREKFTFPVLLDQDDSAWAIYQQRGIPANYVIDTKGIIRYLKPGAFMSVEEMEAFADAARTFDNE